MSGAYAEAMVAKLHDMLDVSRDFYGVDFGPRVAGQYCPWPCIDPFLVIDHNIKPGSAYILDGYRYQGRA
jgi:hypothetical protein